jgi:general secretion pathway protein I
MALPMLRRIGLPLRLSGRGECGFTLLEMLVALSVFSLAALALIRLQAFSTRNAAEIELRVIAQSVVRNRAVEILTDPRPPALGSSSGTEENGGIRWRWTQQTKPAPEGGLLQIDIAARDTQGRTSAGLTVLRPAALLLDAAPPDVGQDFGGQ